MRRLEEIGLVGSEEESTGRRPRRRYQLTAAGLAALRGWLAPPHPADAYTVLFDPLRTRILFLDALDSAAQRLFLEEAEAGLERHLQELEEIYRQIQESGDRPAVLATRAGILSTRARLQWLAELRAAVSED
ncbi:MAG: hypothetical protein DWQ01_10145 [Planctomycetota bacterium]|nr:MAG: hypothetical protein DWQ01_10145 [Planctomycetota bacterium]